MTERHIYCGSNKVDAINQASNPFFLFRKFKTNLYENNGLIPDFGTQILSKTEVVSQFYSNW